MRGCLDCSSTACWKGRLDGEARNCEEANVNEYDEEDAPPKVQQSATKAAKRKDLKDSKKEPGLLLLQKTSYTGATIELSGNLQDVDTWTWKLKAEALGGAVLEVVSPFLNGPWLTGRLFSPIPLCVVAAHADKVGIDMTKTAACAWMDIPAGAEAGGARSSSDDPSLPPACTDSDVSLFTAGVFLCLDSAMKATGALAVVSSGSSTFSPEAYTTSAAMFVRAGQHRLASSILAGRAHNLESIAATKTAEYALVCQLQGGCIASLDPSSDAALAHFEAAFRVYESLGETRMPQCAILFHQMSQYYFAKKADGKAHEMTSQALQCMEDLAADECPECGEMFNAIARYFDSSDAKVRLLEKAKSALKASNALWTLEFALVCRDLGRNYSGAGKPTKAVDEFLSAEKALNLLGKVAAKYRGAVLVDLAKCRCRQGCVDDAVRLLYQAEQILSSDEESGEVLKELASCCYQTGQYKMAFGSYSKARQMLPESESRALMCSSGMCLGKQGKHEEALGMFRLAQYAGKIPPSPTEKAMILRCMGCAESNLGHHREAMGHFLTAQTIFDNEEETRSEEFIMLLCDIGVCYYNQKSYSNAMVFFSRARAFFEACGGASSPTYALLLYAMAACQYDEGHKAAACGLFEASKDACEVAGLIQTPQYVSILHALAASLRGQAREEDAKQVCANAPEGKPLVVMADYTTIMDFKWTVD